MAHNLFGGIITNSTIRSVHMIDLSNIESTFQRQCQLIEVDTICGTICPTPRGAWLEDLRAHDINLSDLMENECPIHILFGGDIASRLYTRKNFRDTYGTTRFRMMPDSDNEIFSSESTVLLIHSMHVSAARIHDLWNLDIIGIHVPVEEKSN